MINLKIILYTALQYTRAGLIVGWSLVKIMTIWWTGEEELSFADDWLWVTMNRGRKQGWHKHAKFVCFLFPSWPFLLLRKIDRPSVTTKRWRGIDKTQLMPVDVGQPASSAIACLRATNDFATNYSTSALSSDLNSCISFNHGMKTN